MTFEDPGVSFYFWFQLGLVVLMWVGIGWMFIRHGQRNEETPKK